MNAVFVDFPQTLRAGREYAIDFYYSGMPNRSRASAASPSARTRPAATG